MAVTCPRIRSLLLPVVALTTSVAFAAGGDDVWSLQGTKVYIGPDTAPINDGVVLVRAGRIAAVGRKQEVSIPAGTRVSECSGGVIAAGFQNSHVHFTGEQWGDASRKPAAALSESMVQMLTRFGFTTVLDTGSDLGNTLALRSRIEKGEVAGPRILTAGAPLYPPKGIPIYLRDLPPEVLARLPQPETPEQARQILRQNLTAGADATKLFVATPQGKGVIARMPGPIAEIAAVETHRREKLLVAHPTDVDGIRAALAADVDVIVHTTLGAKTPWPEDMVKQMVADDMSVVPTLKLWRYELKKDRNDPVPEPVIQRLVGATLEELRTFSAAGGQVLFGTDVGYMTEYDPTDEYVLMTQAGLTPMQILASLTTAPASRWKESKHRGQLKAGMQADVVVLNGDPAADPRHFAAVRCTFRQGQAIYTAR